MEKKLNMQFQIKGVEVLEVELKPPKKILSPEVIYNFNLSLEHKLSAEQKLLMVFVGVKVRNKNDEKTILGRILVNCVYAIENFDEIVTKVGPQKYDVPDEIIELLNSISISTTRGVMAAMFKGTFLHNAVLPVVDPKKIGKRKVPSVKK